MNEFKPEEDFEKGENLKLIEEIRSIKRRQLSDKFDENFYSKRAKAKFKLPLYARTKNKFQSLVTIFNFSKYSYYYAAGFAVIFIFLTGYLVFFQKPVTFPPDLSKNSIDTLNKQNDTIQSKNIPLAANNFNQNNSHYWNTIFSAVENKMNYRSVDLSVRKIKKIIYSEEFRKRINSIKNNILTNKDTIDIVIRILKTK